MVLMVVPLGLPQERLVVQLLAPQQVEQSLEEVLQRKPLLTGVPRFLTNSSQMLH